MAQKLYKIGTVANVLATSVRTIRYYEEVGLLTPIRTQSGTRLYHETHIRRLQAALQLAKNGFSIDFIRFIATTRATCETGDESSQKMGIFFDKALTEIAEKITHLEILQHTLRTAQKTIEKCRGCSHTPSTQGCPTCPVKAHLKENELLSLIWDQVIDV